MLALLDAGGQCDVQEVSTLGVKIGKSTKISKSDIATAAIVFCVLFGASILAIKAYQIHRKRVQQRSLQVLIGEGREGGREGGRERERECEQLMEVATHVGCSLDKCMCGAKLQQASMHFPQMPQMPPPVSSDADDYSSWQV
jgi:hypothetical protein